MQQVKTVIRRYYMRPGNTADDLVGLHRYPAHGQNVDPVVERRTGGAASVNRSASMQNQSNAMYTGKCLRIVESHLYV